MAHSIPNQISRGSSLSDRLAFATESLRKAVARRQTYRRTLHELAALSNRELADLGLNRSEIRRVAWQAAQEQMNA